MAGHFNPAIGKSTQWKKGESGNRGGRPRIAALSQAYRELLAQHFPGDSAKRTFAQIIASRVAAAALNGNIRAASELADRTEGRIPEALAIVSPVNQAPSRPEYDNLTLEELKECMIERVLQFEKLIKEHGLSELLDARRTALAGTND